MFAYYLKYMTWLWYVILYRCIPLPACIDRLHFFCWKSFICVVFFFLISTNILNNARVMLMGGIGKWTEWTDGFANGWLASGPRARTANEWEYEWQWTICKWQKMAENGLWMAIDGLIVFFCEWFYKACKWIKRLYRSVYVRKVSLRVDAVAYF